jgi:hypothetical protein
VLPELLTSLPAAAHATERAEVVEEAEIEEPVTIPAAADPIVVAASASSSATATAEDASLLLERAAAAEADGNDLVGMPSSIHINGKEVVRSVSTVTINNLL